MQKMSCRKCHITAIRKKNASTQGIDTPRAHKRSWRWWGWRWWPAAGQHYLMLGCADREEIQQRPLTSIWEEWEGRAQSITSMITDVLVHNGARPSCLFLAQESISRRPFSQPHWWSAHVASSVFSHSSHSWEHWVNLQKLTVCVRCLKIALCRYVPLLKYLCSICIKAPGGRCSHYLSTHQQIQHWKGTKRLHTFTHTNPDSYGWCIGGKSQLWVYYAILIAKWSYWGTCVYFPEYFPNQLSFPERSALV